MNKILITLLILFLLSFWWAVKQYRIIKYYQYVGDKFYSSIMLMEDGYQTGIVHKDEPYVFSVKEMHTSFRSAERRRKKLTKHCRHLNAIQLKEYPKELKKKK